MGTPETAPPVAFACYLDTMNLCRCMAVLAMICGVLGGCASVVPGDRLARSGDEIVACGQYFHTGAPVVLWTDPGGYDAYRVEKRFAPPAESDWDAMAKAGFKEPVRYNTRRDGLTPEQLEQVRGGGWDLDLLRERVDQFVLHYDVCGTSRTCFRVLHDMRGLSVHFMLDIDGTIYQTLDIKERAWHATSSNARSVGIEIANIGAYPPGKAETLSQWYAKDESGRTVITLPSRLAGGGVRTPGFVGSPARPEPVSGTIQGTELLMYDLTPQQYDSLIKLTAALARICPKIRIDYPRGSDGKLITSQLDADSLKSYAGLLGHYHIQDDKTDPGPALDWDKVITGARSLVGSRGPASSDPMPLHVVE